MNPGSTGFYLLFRDSESCVFVEVESLHLGVIVFVFVLSDA